MALLGVLHVPQCSIAGDATDLSKCNGTVGGVAAEKPFNTKFGRDETELKKFLNFFCYSVVLCVMISDNKNY